MERGMTQLFYRDFRILDESTIADTFFLNKEIFFFQPEIKPYSSLKAERVSKFQLANERL